MRIGFDWRDPPKNKPHVSLEKLASIAKHLALHYARGWAGGSKVHCIYWEVWNEPDIDRFWSGSPEEYFDLYGAVARAIKEVAPEHLVGGPAIAYDPEFLEKFLEYCKEHKVPLDFVSWHIYTDDPKAVAEKAWRVRRLMMKYGYGDLLSVLDEWNYWWNKEPQRFFRSSKAAAFQVAVLIYLQDAPVDVAALYRGDAWNWGGIFHEDGRPGKPYYAWMAFKRLIEESEQRVRVRVEREAGSSRRPRE